MQDLKCSSRMLCVRECSLLWGATTNITTTATGQCLHTDTLPSLPLTLHLNCCHNMLLNSTVVFVVAAVYFHRDCLALCCLNSATSIFAGFAVFSVLGFMSHELGVPMEEVATSGK